MTEYPWEQKPFELDERHRLLEQLAKTYVDRCDAYDRRVCTGRPGRDGVPLAADPCEAAVSLRYARFTRVGALAGAHRLGFTADDLHQAIRMVLNHA